jgi:hypothetical protein
MPLTCRATRAINIHRNDAIWGKKMILLIGNSYGSDIMGATISVHVDVAAAERAIIDNANMLSGVEWVLTTLDEAQEFLEEAEISTRIVDTDDNGTMISQA